MLPNEPIQVRLTGAGIVLSGVVSGKAKVHKAMSLARAYVGKGAVNMMTVGGTQQVMLKVRIAEMSRSAAKALGIDGFINGTSSDVGSVLHSGPTVTSVAIGPGATAVSRECGSGWVDGPNGFRGARLHRPVRRCRAWHHVERAGGEGLLSDAGGAEPGRALGQPGRASWLVRMFRSRPLMRMVRPMSSSRRSGLRSTSRRRCSMTT